MLPLRGNLLRKIREGTSHKAFVNLPLVIKGTRIFSLNINSLRPFSRLYIQKQYTYWRHFNSVYRYFMAEFEIQFDTERPESRYWYSKAVLRAMGGDIIRHLGFADSLEFANPSFQN